MADERYTIEHVTRYAYTAPVSQSWQLARLTPRVLPWQKPLSHSLQIDPPPDERHDAADSFGNTVTHFGLHGAHRVLRVRMQCSVDVGQRPLPVEGGEAETWESVRDAVRSDPTLDDLNPARMCEPTPLVPMSDAARDYAAPCFAPEHEWLDAVSDLMHRIHADVPHCLAVRGVCSDHHRNSLASIACLLQRRLYACGIAR